MNKLIICAVLILLLAGFVNAADDYVPLQLKIKSVEGKELYGGYTGEYINNKAYQGETVWITITALNLDGLRSTTKKIECGIYDEDLVEGWYGKGFSLFSWIPVWSNNVPNCIPAETFVQTKEVSFSEGEGHTIHFAVTAPKDMKLDYIVHCADYVYCYKDSVGDTGQTDYATASFTLLDKPNVDDDPDPTCGDNSINQDETDINCGGKTCPPCYDGYKCGVDGDCQSKSCEDGRCAEQNADGNGGGNGGGDGDGNGDGDGDELWNSPIFWFAALIIPLLVIGLILIGFSSKK